MRAAGRSCHAERARQQIWAQEGLGTQGAVFGMVGCIWPCPCLGTAGATSLGRWAVGVQRGSVLGAVRPGCVLLLLLCACCRWQSLLSGPDGTKLENICDSLVSSWLVFRLVFLIARPLCLFLPADCDSQVLKLQVAIFPVATCIAHFHAHVLHGEMDVVPTVCFT